MRKYTISDKVFMMIIYVLLGGLLIITLYPLIYLVMASISAGPQYMPLYLIPKKFSLAGYEAVIQYEPIWRGYANSFINMAISSVISLCLTMMCAYALSRPEFRFGGVVMFLCMVTQFFSGGLIPSYLLVKNLGILNTRWSLILPGAMSVYNMIIARTYIKSSIPNEIRESAQMDGCSHIRYLVSMVVPLSKSILAVLFLYYAIGDWNSYFNAMIYVGRRKELYPLALVLREILVQGTTELDMYDVTELLAWEERQNVMKYATIVVGTLPLMVMYPFIQKHFVKGVMIGSVKG